MGFDLALTSSIVLLTAVISVMCVVYMFLTIVIEEGWFALPSYQIRRFLSPILSCILIFTVENEG